MKTRSVILIILVAIVAGTVGHVTAGVEPTPFKEVINKLNAVVHRLDAADRKVSETLAEVPYDEQVAQAVADVKAKAMDIVAQADVYLDAGGDPLPDTIP